MQEKRTETINQVIEGYKILSEISTVIGKVLEGDKKDHTQEVLYKLLLGMQEKLGTHYQNIDLLARANGVKIKEYEGTESDDAIDWNKLYEFIKTSLE
ncbi:MULTISPECIES: hypothetical protein [unclassified Anabaena]|uniref:hypothetical protein n=1 Tax=unclassified Anabaena TaxID=2619674 RepID=UPI0006AC5C69|nr:MULTISPECIES: hypothetical protein [unclassified Anabaena]ALB39896.1 hypothetical protein AA650_04940 [Anabaena sp. WA102]OBQ17637.1 MAG: hypothetical protein AN486_14550 [Anabaena sp. AL93]